MRERIIVPLDGSKVGESALPYVEDLMSKMSPEVEKEVVLLQVLTKEQVAPQVTVATAARTQAGVFLDIDELEKKGEETKTQALHYLDEVGETLRDEGITVTAKLAVGNAAEEIVKTAEETDANLIAMSTHGRSGLSRWAFGSVTDRVLRWEGKIPIAMIRAPKKS